MADEPHGLGSRRPIITKLTDLDPDEIALRRRLLTRAVDAVDRISYSVDGEKLREAVDADTDTAFLAVLSQLAKVDAVAAASDPLVAARARGEQAKRDILASQGDMYYSDEVAARLGWPADFVEERRQAGMLLALPLDDGSWGFPVWQFSGPGLIPGLEDVLYSLTAKDPWSRVQFLQSGDPYFAGHTPLEMIRQGQAETVRRLAAAYDELVAT